MNKNSKSGDIINPIAVFKDVDEPFSNNIKTAFSIAENRTQALKNKEISSLENKANYADRMDKHWYKKYGLDLMIGCGVVYILLVVFDTIACNLLEWQTSELMNGLIELLKFVVSTLIGFVFSESRKKDNN